MINFRFVVEEKRNLQVDLYVIETLREMIKFNKRFSRQIHLI